MKRCYLDDAEIVDAIKTLVESGDIVLYSRDEKVALALDHLGWTVTWTGTQFAMYKEKVA